MSGPAGPPAASAGAVPAPRPPRARTDVPPRGAPQEDIFDAAAAAMAVAGRGLTGR
jgi:hypothetical protein